MRPLGILMLDGKMSTEPGMMGSDATWPYPVRRKVVEGTSTPMSVEDATAMAPLYVRAAKELERDGVGVLTANCGLMAFAQQEVAASVGVPVVMSSLVAVPTIARMCPTGSRIGVLTFFDGEVGEANFLASGWSSRDIDVAVAGVGRHPSWLEFLRTKEIHGSQRADLVRDLREVVDGLLRKHPDIGALVAECTMLPAVLDELRGELAVPLFDLLTVLDWTMAAQVGRHARRAA